MKKFLLMFALFVLPIVAMEESDSSGSGTDNEPFGDGRSERWTVGPGADEKPRSEERQTPPSRGFEKKILPESRAVRLAREQRVADAEERRARQKSSKRRCCFSFIMRQKKFY